MLRTYGCSLEKKSPSGSWTQVEAKATNSLGPCCVP